MLKRLARYASSLEQDGSRQVAERLRVVWSISTLMYCRKKNRSRWRYRVAESRRNAKPRGQSVMTPTVKELLVRDRGGYTLIDMIGCTHKRCRSIRNRTKQILERVQL